MTLLNALNTLCETKDNSAIIRQLQSLDSRSILIEAKQKIGEKTDSGVFAYMHANGFVKITIAEIGGIVLRLHHWQPSTSERIYTTIHNHRWNLYSKVISGEVTDVTYDISVEVKSDEYSCFKYTSSGVDERLERIGAIKLNISDCEKYVAGDCYTVPFGSIHQSLVAPGSVTLVVTAPAVCDFTKVYLRGLDSKKTINFTRSYVSSHELLSCINHVLAIT